VPRRGATTSPSSGRGSRGARFATSEAAELFEDVRLAKVPVEREATTAKLLAFVRTTSSYLRLEPARQEVLEHRLAAVVEDAGGTYRSTMYDTLVTARVRTPAG
jgi:hypothetical protein